MSVPEEYKEYWQNKAREGNLGLWELKDKITSLENQLTAERAKVALVVDALNALLIMTDRGPCPKKLDAALTWRANDELARSKALAAIEAGKQSAGSEEYPG
jgi:hypothetical protein